MKRKTKPLFPSKLAYINLYVLFLISCTSLSKKAPLHSQKLSLKIYWTYADPTLKTSTSFSSFVFLQEERFLRLDVFQNFIGVIGSLILNDQFMMIQTPLNKAYYTGSFDSQLFFPEFPSFPGSWLRYILRAKASDKWECEKRKEQLTHCRVDFFTVTWKYKKAQLYEIQLEDSMKRQITAKIQNISIGTFSPDIFNPSALGLVKQKNPLFFQNF